MKTRLCLAIVLAATLGGLTTGAASAATALPAHVYVPHFETWTTDSLTTTAQHSGTKYFTLAFLETLSKTSCTLAWDGSRTDPCRTATTSPTLPRCVRWAGT